MAEVLNLFSDKLLDKAVNFHPLFKKLHEKYNFDGYYRNTFVNDKISLELVFECGVFITPMNHDGYFVDGKTYSNGNNEYEQEKLKLNINYISVNENERRKGIGSEVLNTICEYADELGIDSITLQISPKFNVSKEALIEFYEKNGFTLFDEDNLEMFKLNKRFQKDIAVNDLSFDLSDFKNKLISGVNKWVEVTVKEYMEDDREGTTKWVKTTSISLEKLSSIVTNNSYMKVNDFLYLCHSVSIFGGMFCYSEIENIISEKEYNEAREQFKNIFNAHELGKALSIYW